ncbi:carbohydrate-binding protein [Sphaerisporangium corydalis]|uniref:CBM35 domain-containing protein n=1 Tax=Sphaerisporangium corydalis TaxID=1441875 RepID=A0ABV9ESK8_9ACTN|nr:CBM35 domain-containing protein [Sphaerisporangium corydalis]
MRRKARSIAAACLAVCAGMAAQAAALPAYAAGATLVVNVAAPFRPVTHAASGGLYGLAEGNRPPDSMLLPVHPRNFTQPAPGVQQRPNGQPPGGDSLLVAPQADRTGAGVVIRMPDIYPDFPYRWVSWNDWLAKVDTQVSARLAATSVSNIEGYELWNEPDYTWNTSAAGAFNAGWVRTFQRVRARDPITPIVGPSTSYYNATYLRSFLTYARDNNALPDVVCWHELGQNPSSIAADIAAYRAMEQSLGISPRPIAINEYAGTAAVDVPGTVAGFVAKLERGGVDSADRAFWYEYGTMNGLVVNGGQPTGTWWLYKWYGDMSGNMVTTTPPSQTGLDGFASYDPTRKIVNVVFGGESGANTVRLTGLGALGSTVRVRLESTPSSGRFTQVAAPTTLSDTTYAVSGGQVSVAVPSMAAGSAYHLVVQPTSGVPSYQQRYEAENASVFRAARLGATSASSGAYVGRIDNTGDFRTDSYVDFAVNVPAARAYTMRIGYANGSGATATQGLAYNGGAWSTVSYPATGAWGQFGSTVSTSVNLRAGFNVIRLAKGSPYFAGGTGYAELDYIELT